MSKFIDLTGQKYNRLTCKAYDKIRGAWVCECECGNIRTVTRYALIHGTIKSCGCFRKATTGYRLSTTRNRKSAFEYLYVQYKSRASNKKREFSISKDDFAMLTKQNCFYCGEEPKLSYNPTTLAHKEPYIYNGLDRIDSSKGYSIENVVPCCKHCNVAKNSMTTDEFMDWIEKVYKHSFRQQFILYPISHSFLLFSLYKTNMPPCPESMFAESVQVAMLYADYA